jgi:hypothetical protein
LWLDTLAVDLHDVVPSDNRVQLARGTVHQHSPARDQLVGAAAGRHTRTGEEGIQSH